MLNYKVIVLCIATLGVSSGAGIEELLLNASAVVEGAVVDVTIIGPEITLKLRVSSTLSGSIPEGATIPVTCNSLKNVQSGSQSAPRSGFFFLRSSQVGGWECVPVFSLGYSGLGFLSYPQAPPCKEGNLQSLAPSSLRERILVRGHDQARRRIVR